MEGVAARLLDQWVPLTLYFQGYLLEQNDTAHKINHTLNDPRAKSFFSFLAYILPIVNLMNVTFQSETVRIHNFLETIRTGLRQIMSNFLLPAVLGNGRKDPFEIDHKNPHNFRVLNKMYFGAKFEDMLQPGADNQWRCEADVDNLRKQFLAFYIELCTQIKRRINHKDDLLNSLQCIDPNVAFSGSVPSLVPLRSRFRNTFKLDVETLDSEWRSLVNNDALFDRFNEYQRRVEKEGVKKKRKSPPLRTIENVPSGKQIRQRRRERRAELLDDDEADWSDSSSSDEDDEGADVSEVDSYTASVS